MEDPKKIITYVKVIQSYESTSYKEKGFEFLLKVVKTASAYLRMLAAKSKWVKKDDMIFNVFKSIGLLSSHFFLGFLIVLIMLIQIFFQKININSFHHLCLYSIPCI